MPRLSVPHLLLGLSAALLCGCAQQSADPEDRNNLDVMNKTRIEIKGHTFEVWLARTPSEQEHGLMQVTAEQLAALPDGSHRGMLFVFTAERQLSFWMYNTITPLDIVYIRGDGVIVRKYTMAPLETRLYPSVEPAMYALEVRAGLFAELGIAPGDTVQIGDLTAQNRASALKPTS